MFLNKKSLLFYLLLAILLLTAIPFGQLFFILVFGIIMAFLTKGKIKIDERSIFYMGIMALTASQFLLFWLPDYSQNYLINTSLTLLFWTVSFFIHLIIKACVEKMDVVRINKLLDVFFYLNLVLIVLQFIMTVKETGMLNPFGSTMKDYGMSTGDFLSGIFPNSSLSMVVFSFFSVFYAYKKDKKIIPALIAMVLSTYMSGILIFGAIIFLYIFIAFKLKVKVRILVAVLIIFFALNKLTPSNIDYVEKILTEKVGNPQDPARKIVSFEQTFTTWTSDPLTFVYGVGAGKYSSRVAFITGGDYADWYPNKWVYKSDEFKQNHFKLWNKYVLSLPFNDGTHNQPFSFYNQIIGEYGLLGLMLFMVYMLYVFKRWHLLTYGKPIALVMLGFLILDYWFDYFVVILFFELFINLNLKDREIVTP